MPEILTQEEVDSLLSAVTKGGLPRPSEAMPSPRRQRNVLVYDFRRPNRISKEQVRTLQILHDTFARTVNFSLSAYLRSLVEVRLTSLEQLTYGEFILSVLPPSALGIFEMAPLKGGAVLDINPHVVFPMIDRILGGSGRASIQVRELTEIERKLLERIIRRLLVDLQQAWLQVGKFEIRLLNLETNPQFVQLTSANEIAILATFDVRVGEVNGVMSLCLPFAMLEPILPKLVTQRWFDAAAAGETGGAAAEEMTRHLRTIPVDVRAVVGAGQIPIGRLTRLAPGDILPLATGRELRVTLEVEGRPLFAGRVGQRQRKRAVEITTVWGAGGDEHA
jgi:flagellar motor switch protein FliM